MWPNTSKTADFAIFTEEILNGKLHFLCSASQYQKSNRKIFLWNYNQRFNMKMFPQILQSLIVTKYKNIYRKFYYEGRFFSLESEKIIPPNRF